ncbi:hypothetical protein ANO14919_141100 [Xylariales sp. No.14919]|nr:hypothetical protein ANO14919_141100 [Xylariales sp. No.14919]
MATFRNDTDYYPVHLGTWTNWSRDSVLGRTLTVRRREGDLLIAFTALFVALVSSRGWRIISFILHRHNTSHIPQGAVYHQYQAILRNSDTQSSILQLAELLWANRLRKSIILKPLLLFLAATVYTVAFTVAGGFSSQVSTAVGTEVLLESMNCGWDDFEAARSEDLFLQSAIFAPKIYNAANYAQQCYSNDSVGILDCSRLTTKRISAQIDTEASCPFQHDICRSNSTNLRIDSGYMNSHDHFGINAPVDKRMLVRTVLHCAPMETRGYSSQKNTTIGNVTVYHYGNATLVNTDTTDYMATAKPIESQYSYLLSPDTFSFGANYELSPAFTYVKNRNLDYERSNFIPIDSIFRRDADLAVIFLAGNGVTHTKPSNDDWYRVSPTAMEVGISGSNSSGGTYRFFLPLEDASPLGCTRQWQFCNRSPEDCSPLGSMVDAIDGAATIFNFQSKAPKSKDSNDTRAAYFDYFKAVIHSSPSLIGILQQIGPASLKSQSTLIAGRQGPLPSNQWQLDAIHWFDIQMAGIQLHFLGAAYFNPTDPSFLNFRKPFTGEQRNLCMNQKIRSTAYTSFSLFGLLFTFIVGTVIIIASFLLEPAFSLLYKKYGYSSYATLEWATNTTLQLQRLAHEGLGFGTWSKGTEKVPITRADDLLGCLDLSDPSHPVLGSNLATP